ALHTRRERRPTMRVKGRWHVTSKLLVLVGATVIASSQLIGTSARAADPIKVGWVGPLSPPGGYAEGALMKQAAEVAADELNAKGYPEVFRVAPNQALIAAKYGDWMAAAGFKNVAVMFEKTDGGQSGRDVLLPVLDKHGIKYEVVGADPSATEFTAQIERFKS